MHLDSIEGACGRSCSLALHGVGVRNERRTLDTSVKEDIHCIDGTSQMGLFLVIWEHLLYESLMSLIVTVMFLRVYEI